MLMVDSAPSSKSIAMLNSLLNKQHIREYLIYGLTAGILFMIPASVFIFSDNYANAYYLYIGTAIYMAVIFMYTYRLLHRPIEKKRATMVIMAAHGANVVGVLTSFILSVISCAINFPGLFVEGNTRQLVNNLPPQIAYSEGKDILFMVLVITLLANGGAGSFISVITTYAGKENQTKDKPTLLEKNVPSPAIRPLSA